MWINAEMSKTNVIEPIFAVLISNTNVWLMLYAMQSYLFTSQIHAEDH